MKNKYWQYVLYTDFARAGRERLEILLFHIVENSSWFLPQAEENNDRQLTDSRPIAE